MSAHRERGVLLMQQGRLEMAVEEFGRALVEDPTDAFSHACTALCLTELGKLDDARRGVGEAIRHDPESAFCQYVLGTVELHAERYPEARRAALETIRIEPGKARNFSLLARIHLVTESWEEARAAAEEGLRVDPTDVACLNAHSMALQQLGRPGDARQVLEAALARDPENAETQATAGWAALKDNDARAALAHFKEALRIDPTLDHARSGVVESLKARNFLYALMLRYFFWMGRLSNKARWGAIIGGYVVFRILRQVARSNPEAAPWVWPFLGLYIVFVFLTWTAEPLANLLLRLHPVGRLALSRQDVVASNCVGACMLGAFSAVGWWLATKDDVALAAAAGALLLTMPVAGVFSCPLGWRRRAAGAYALGLAVVGLAAVALWISRPASPGAKAVLNALGIVFVIGILLSTWITNALSLGKSRA
jgi:tetratricopeptide (TPR) repeat protein